MHRNTTPRRLLVSMLHAAVVAVASVPSLAVAGPPQPGPTPSPPGKYIVRNLGDPQRSDNSYSQTGYTRKGPLISGTSVAWMRDGYQKKEPRLYNPVQSDTQSWAIPSAAWSPIEIQQYDVLDEGIYFLEQGKPFESMGPPATVQPLPIPPGATDAWPAAEGASRAWVRLDDPNAVNPLMHLMGRFNGNDISIEAASAGLYQPLQISGEYLTYFKALSATEVELWGYHFPTQTKSLLTDPNYTWSFSSTATNVDLDGSRVVWAASYSDNGPLYADHEVYTCDLADGPIDFNDPNSWISYRQVTQNSLDDILPRVAGDRIAWSSAAEHSPIPETFIEEGGNVESVGTGLLMGLSESTIAWCDPFAPHIGHAPAVSVHIETFGHHHTLNQIGIFTNYSNKGVSGANLTFDGVEENNTYADVWAAYYAGPGGVLTGLDLTYEEFAELKLTWADMRLVDLTGADLTGTDLRGTDLTGATGLEYTSGAAIFSHQTILPAYFNAHDAGWSYVTPEPGTLLLALLGLLGMSSCRRGRAS